MFALTQSMHYYLYPKAVDMRKGIWSLYELVRSGMNRNPLSGEVFVFYGRRHDTIKLLHWENDGFVLYIRKLTKGTFETPPINPSNGHFQMPWRTFVLMMEGVSITTARFRKRLHLTS